MIIIISIIYLKICFKTKLQTYALRILDFGFSCLTMIGVVITGDGDVVICV